MCAWLVVGAASDAGAQPVIPDEPPYCTAGNQSGSGNLDGGHTPEGSTYCLGRVVEDRYAAPPDGWDAYVGTFSEVTASFPSFPVTEGWPVPPNYPHVVITYHKGNPNGVPRWFENQSGYNMNDPSGTPITLVRLEDCQLTDMTCDYEVQGGPGVGDPPAWYQALFAEDVLTAGGTDLESFADVSVGIGLAADGNNPPTVYLTVATLQDPLSYNAVATATDPDLDAISGYVFDWGDQTTTAELPDNHASHTYASGAQSYVVRAYAIDARGAVGSAQQDVGNLVSINPAGPHTVAVGDQFQIDVGITNIGTAAIDALNEFVPQQLRPASPVLSVLQFVTHPDFADQFEIDPGNTAHAVYVVKALTDATLNLQFGVKSHEVPCAICGPTMLVDYPLTLGNGGPTPNPTATSATPTATSATPTVTGGTPTATATATHPSATPTPGPSDKVVRKCRAAIITGASTLVDAETRAESACAAKVTSGKLPPGTTCRTETKTAATIAKAQAKLRTAVAKACGGADKTCGAGGDDLPLAAIGWQLGTCPGIANGTCSNAIADCDGIATCLTCIGETVLDAAVGLAHDGLTPADPKDKSQKALARCEAAIGTAAATALLAQENALAKCWEAVNAGSTVGACPSADGKATAAITTAKAKAATAICKACGGADKACGGADDFTPLQIGFTASCLSVSPPGAPSCAAAIGTVQDIATCLDCVTAFDAACSTTASASGVATYPPECHPLE